MTEVPEWRVPDVDRVGAPPLCSALRSKVRQLSRAEDEEGFGPLAPLGSEFSYGDGLLAAPEGLGTEEGIPNFVRHLIVTPCHGPAILVPAHSERRNLVQGWHLELSGAILTWDTGHKSLLSDIEEEFGPGEGNLRHGTLASFNVHTHKRRTWPLPILTLRVTIDDRKPISRSTVGTFGYSAHTDHEVFWIAARSFSCPPGFSEEHCGGLTNNEVSSIYAVQV